MFDILDELRHWVAQGKPVALCVVLKTWGSSPRRPGAHMAVVPSGEVAGSVSGGCVESAVIEAALECLTENRARVLHFGVADEEAWEVGLACGGEIDILVMSAPERFLRELFSAIDSVGRAEYRATVSDGGEANLEVLPISEWQGSLRLERDMEWLCFSCPITPGIELVLIGAGHLAQAIARLADVLGYAVTVIDPRRVFADPGRFPPATRVIHAWPQEALEPGFIRPYHVVITLTHDPKIDDPALIRALASPAAFIGALGSRKTHAQRRERLLRAGVSENQLARVFAPVGLDLGSVSVEEMAFEVLGEIMAMRNNVHLDKPYKHPVSKSLPPRA